MKKFICKIVAFFLLVVVVDLLFGVVCSYLYNHTKGGQYWKVRYSCEEQQAPVVLLGSSRMEHHCVPEVMAPVLGKEVYNAGFSANGVFFAYAALMLMTERYTPELVVYDAYADVYGTDNEKFMDVLKLYKNKSYIRAIITDIAPRERIYMLSSMYCYNSIFLELLAHNVFSVNKYIKGYLPLNDASMDYEPHDIENVSTLPVDEVKLSYLRKMIGFAKERQIKFVVSISPQYKIMPNSQYYSYIRDICQEENIPLLDFSADEDISTNREYFIDSIHLNDKGAHEYSIKLAQKLLDNK